MFASGVSNSRETDPEEFARERRMLEKALAQGKQLVYFSSCSIADPDQANAPYVLHKQAQEQLIAERASRYAIFRLPQVVGRIDNPHTLTNYLYQTISSGDVFHVWTKARRNLIDVDDVAAIGARLLQRGDANNRVTNIACPYSVAILDLVRIFEAVMDRRAYFDLIESGGSYQIDVALAMSAAAEAGIIIDDNYINQLIRKYYAD
ncbi:MULTISPECIES: NAD(P)-dependent oxidoreductase [unclassified Duganella]|uniref:NAD-dependent epimerase/dehydratase family protein n=1 Tax=unclassified Duganella TaxID=2636909 RepID=UPI001587012F|nr:MULTISPECIES: NAD-dependent epimerase/dehydratase family protein [unclassified Duganella]